MNDTYLTDFYQGWLIEVIQTECGFKGMCHSPCRERFSDGHIYASDLDATSAVKREIDRHITCATLLHLLRELYEAEHLSFDEWQLLRQSLAPAKSVP